MSTLTPNYNLIMPTVGGDSVLWATWTNENWVVVDGALHDHDTGLGVHSTQIAALDVRVDALEAASGVNQEQVQDWVAPMFTASPEITATYDDPTNALTFALIAGSVALSKLADLSPNRLVGRSAGFGAPEALSFGSAFTITGTQFELRDTGVTTEKLADDLATNEKLRDSVALSVIGRAANSVGNPGDIEAFTSGHVLRRNGTALGFGTLLPASFANNTVPLLALEDVASARIMGRVTGSLGPVEALTGTQATTLLDVFTSALKGLAPASGGGTLAYLRADGTWAIPPAGLDTESVQDIVGAMVVGADGVAPLYDDGTGFLTVGLGANQVALSRLVSAFGASVLGYPDSSTDQSVTAISASADGMVLIRRTGVLVFEQPKWMTRGQAYAHALSVI